MMGKQLPQTNLFSYRVDLERRIGQDPCLRKEGEKIDFGIFWEDGKCCHGAIGDEGPDPPIILKQML